MTGESIPLRGLEGVPGLPGAPQDEAGLRRIKLNEDSNIPTKESFRFLNHLST